MGVAMVSFSQDEAVVERLLQLPFVNVCTDGLLGGRPHPRAYGTYPRVLARYVRERRALPLEEAVRKMTSRAALAFGLGDVGFLREGFRANVVVFDPETVQDRATFEDPLQYPRGHPRRGGGRRGGDPGRGGDRGAAGAGGSVGHCATDEHEHEHVHVHGGRIGERGTDRDCVDGGLSRLRRRGGRGRWGRRPWR